MTKRASGKHKLRERSFYATPAEAIWHLLPHLTGVTTFVEPMCGNGAIVEEMERLGWECSFMSDMCPQWSMELRAVVADVLSLTAADFAGADAVISNPPWPLSSRDRKGLSPGEPTLSIILHLIEFLPVWLIMPADVMHNHYFRQLHAHCTDVISAGRVKWMGSSGTTGFDNAAWFRFEKDAAGGCLFHPLQASEQQFHPDFQALL